MNKTLMLKLTPLLVILLIAGNVTLLRLYQGEKNLRKSVEKDVPIIAENSYFTGCMDAGAFIPDTPRELLVGGCRGASEQFAEPLLKLYGED